MPDFSELLNKPAGEAKRPPILPKGLYPARITKHEVNDNNKNKTPYVRFHLQLDGFPEDVEEADKEGIDLSKRNLRIDYYMTEEAGYRLDEALKVILGDENVAGKSYGEVFPETHGVEVLADVTSQMNQNTNESYNNVSKLIARG